MKAFQLDRSSGLSSRLSNQMVVIILAAIVFLGVAYTKNTFDNFLWRVHLNHSTCIQNGFGAVFCGDDAMRYEQRLRDAGIQP